MRGCKSEEEGDRVIGSQSEVAESSLTAVNSTFVLLEHKFRVHPHFLVMPTLGRGEEVSDADKSDREEWGEPTGDGLHLSAHPGECAPTLRDLF